MKNLYRIAALVLVVMTTPALADVEFWLDNQTNVDLRAEVSTIKGTHFLRPGQKNNTFARGYWSSSKCPPTECMISGWTVTMKHIGDDRINYCVWDVNYWVKEAEKKVDVQVSVRYQAPGMQCASTGQRQAKWGAPHMEQSHGVYLIFTADN